MISRRDLVAKSIVWAYILVVLGLLMLPPPRPFQYTRVHWIGGDVAFCDARANKEYRPQINYGTAPHRGHITLSGLRPVRVIMVFELSVCTMFLGYQVSLML